MMAHHQPGMADGVYFGIARALRKAFPEARSVLEVGCGEGKLLRHLAEMFKEVAGLDRDYNALNKTDPHLHTYVFDIGERPCFNIPQADLIVTWQMLEHLNEHTYQQALRNFWLSGAVTNVHSICLAPPESARRNDPSHTLLRSRAWWLTEFDKAGFRHDIEGEDRLREAGKFSQSPELFVFGRK